jgi:peroxiredoxin
LSRDPIPTEAPGSGGEITMRLTRRIWRLVPRLSGVVLLALVLVLLTGGAAALVLKAPWDGRRARRLLPNRACQVKQFALYDAQGRRHSTEEWRGRKGVVLFFLEPDCPVVNDYAAAMERLSDRYSVQGIVFYGVYSRGSVSAEVAARHAAEAGLSFPVLLDPAQVVAGEAGVRRTPEAALLAPDGQVLYGGRIDARYEPGNAGRSPAGPGDLEAALAAVAHDEMPLVTETRAYGCPLPKPGSVADPSGKRLSRPPSDEEITYTRDVAPILWKNCVMCHRPGQVGPFSLLTYRDAAKRADFLREITASRRMPPWKARPGYGVFLDNLRLSDRELAILARWAEAGAPEGDQADLPRPPQFADGWQLGQPDYVFKVAEPLAIPASGDDVFRSFVIPLPLERDQQVVAFEFRPGNRRVVHHAKLFVVPAGSAQARDLADPGPGFASTGSADLGVPAIWEWTPGTIPRHWPPGVGKRLISGSDLVLFVHYHPSGKPESDQSSIGVYVSKTPLERFIAGIPMGTSHIDIPAGARRHVVTVKTTLPADAHALTLMPHGHLLLREMTLTATRPDGTIERLLWIDDWDFNWQGQYHFAKPVALPRGTELELVGIYDNSADNPRNPSSPPRRVRFGPASTDEMIGCHIQALPDRPQDYTVFRKKWPQGF